MDQRSTSIGAGRVAELNDATGGTRPFPGFPGEAAARADPGAGSSPGCPEEEAAGAKGDGLDGANGEALLGTTTAAGLAGEPLGARSAEDLAGELLGLHIAEK